MDASRFASTLLKLWLQCDNDLSDSDGVGWLAVVAAKRFYTCRLRGAGGGGGGTMIDLSHLTEEEQGVIMEVLKRDTQLKKAEEERIR